MNVVCFNRMIRFFPGVSGWGVFLPLNFPRMSVNLYSENGIYAIIIGRYLSVVAVPDFQKYI